MRFALIGKNISHSRSPAIYRKLIDESVEYDLLDVDSEDKLPKLSDLARNYVGVNITSPYKTHYFNQVTITDPTVAALGFINTLSFQSTGIFGTNTDLLAVRLILKEFKLNHQTPHLVLLGSGSMAKLVTIVAAELGLSLVNISRNTNPNMAHMDLKPFENRSAQNIVINACSRDFVFSGQQSPQNIFWDLNYHFIPHQNALPFLVKEYHDGQEMLFLQAQAAKDFWPI